MTHRTTDVHIDEVVHRVTAATDFRDLIREAAGVANALAVGAGSFIAGTMVETELRRALCLHPGELVTIPKDWE